MCKSSNNLCIAQFSDVGQQPRLQSSTHLHDNSPGSWSTNAKLVIYWLAATGGGGLLDGDGYALVHAEGNSHAGFLPLLPWGRSSAQIWSKASVSSWSSAATAGYPSCTSPSCPTSWAQEWHSTKWSLSRKIRQVEVPVRFHPSPPLAVCTQQLCWWLFHSSYKAIWWQNCQYIPVLY